MSPTDPLCYRVLRQYNVYSRKYRELGIRPYSNCVRSHINCVRSYSNCVRGLTATVYGLTTTVVHQLRTVVQQLCSIVQQLCSIVQQLCTVVQQLYTVVENAIGIFLQRTYSNNRHISITLLTRHICNNVYVSIVDGQFVYRPCRLAVRVLVIIRCNLALDMMTLIWNLEEQQRKEHICVWLISQLFDGDQRIKHYESVY